MRYSVILASIGAFLALASCTEVDTYTEIPANGEGIRISLDCGDIATKTTADGVGNENRIKTVDYFLFDKTDASTYPEYRYRGHLEPDVASNFTFYIHSALVEAKVYTIYVIVNYSGAQSDLGVLGQSDEPTDKRTIAQLDALLLSESTARTFTAAGVTPAAEEDLCLVMTGKGDVTVAPVEGKNIVGTASISLKRLTAKVTMDFYIKDQVVKNHGTVTETWVPLTDGKNIRVYLCNGSESVKIDGTSPSPLSLFDYQPNTDNTVISGKADYSTAFSSAAFYTYPETWTRGEREEPYLKLIVPWKCSRTNAGITTDFQKELYYKVMLPTSSFVSNYWYHLTLDVTQLGSSADEDAVNVTCGYQVADWGTNQDVSSTLAQGFYLDVNSGNLNLELVGNSLDIPFFASGDVEVLKDATYSVTRTDFITNATEDVTSSNMDAVTLSSSGDFISFRHTLDVNYDGASYDVSPYIFTFTVHLVGATSSWDKTVTITQYPPLYIDALDTGRGNNSKYTVWINNNTAESVNYHNVWDNNGSTPSPNIATVATADRYLGNMYKPETAVPTPSTGDNQNPILYTVTATKVALKVTYDEQTYDAVIGDPRAPETNDYNVLTGGGTALTNYRPASPDAKNVIAPQFMCATSYGKTIVMSYEGAVKRCAAYQEYGYPAGRWRLPTPAEVRFLQDLNKDGKIPSLFTVEKNGTRSMGYWTAGKELYTVDGFFNMNSGWTLGVLTSGSYGYLQYTNDSVINVPVRGSVRCVYDTWYWGDKHSTTTSNSWLGYKPNLNDDF